MAKICFKSKSIFFHVPKNAGTSLTVFFGRCGWNTFRYSPIDGPSDTISPDYKYSKGCCIRVRENMKQIAAHNDLEREQGKTIPYFAKNMNSSELQMVKKIDHNTWGDFYKFAFVRNPWDRLISAWKNRVTSIPTFEKFLDYLPFDKRLTDAYWHTMPQYDHLYDEQGKRLVQDIFKYEELDVCVNRIKLKLELPDFSIDKKWNSSGVRKRYSEYYTKTEQIEKVAKIYEKDINQFNYKYR